MKINLLYFDHFQLMTMMNARGVTDFRPRRSMHYSTMWTTRVFLEYP